QLQVVQEKGVCGRSERTNLDTGVEILVVVQVLIAIDLTIGDGQGVVEKIVEQVLAMNHHALVAGGDELVDEGSLQRRDVAVLDELFVTEGLLELASLDLEGIPVMHVAVGVLEDQLPLAEVGKQAELVVIEQNGFHAEASAADEEGVDVGGVVVIDEAL